MSEKRSTVFSDSIRKIYEPVNDNQKFKEKYKYDDFKILLNPKDGNDASLITVKNGTLSVEGIPNNPKSNIDKSKIGWDCMMKTTVQLFKDIGDGTLTGKEIVKNVVARKIKVKNTKLLLKFAEFGNFLK
jgi:hypothetical protein